MKNAVKKDGVCRVCSKSTQLKQATWAPVQYGKSSDEMWMTCGHPRCFVKAILGQTDVTRDAEMIKRLVDVILEGDKK